MLQLSDYDEKKIRAILKSGEIFEGEALYDGPEYCLHEYGEELEALRFGVSDELEDDSWLIWEDEIERIEVLEDNSPEFGLWLHFACRDDFVVTPWSGGTTTQFLIFPRSADYAKRDFLWRISSAAVSDSTSDFTSLPDYNRFITPVAGSMTLTRSGAGSGEDSVSGPVLLRPYDVLAFDGADSTHSEGVCTDFNLMLRKGRAFGRMDAFDLTADPRPLPLLPGIRDLLLWCPDADCRILTPWSGILLPAGECLIAENIRTLALSACAAAPAHLLIAQAGEI
ncbi:MAG: HutD family protein [Lachnospiraceae bacterium]|nr:HutD family protein [Lachnospiraceae bacterium]